jgi:hypothetical protein
MAQKDSEDNDFDAISSRPQGGDDVETTQEAETGITFQKLRNTDIYAGMTTSAQDEFERCVTKFARALAREASRLEEANRAEDVIKAEIVASMVVNANEVLRRPRSEEPKASAFITVAQAASFALAIATPIVFGAGLPTPYQWTATVACGILAVASQIYAIVKVRRK